MADLAEEPDPQGRAQSSTSEMQPREEGSVMQPRKKSQPYMLPLRCE